MLAIFSATQDGAIDSQRIEYLPDNYHPLGAAHFFCETDSVNRFQRHFQPQAQWCFRGALDYAFYAQVDQLIDCQIEMH